MGYSRSKIPVNRAFTRWSRIINLFGEQSGQEPKSREMTQKKKTKRNTGKLKGPGLEQPPSWYLYCGFCKPYLADVCGFILSNACNEISQYGQVNSCSGTCPNGSKKMMKTLLFGTCRHEPRHRPASKHQVLAPVSRKKVKK